MLETISPSKPEALVRIFQVQVVLLWAKVGHPSRELSERNLKVNPLGVHRILCPLLSTLMFYSSKRTATHLSISMTQTLQPREELRNQLSCLETRKEARAEMSHQVTH